MEISAFAPFAFHVRKTIHFTAVKFYAIIWWRFLVMQPFEDSYECNNSCVRSDSTASPLHGKESRNNTGIYILGINCRTPTGIKT